jgi:3'(2'), 5'-bisphosphate nucleotidase/myo-inositol-1(or 4)-monophosphatase
MFRHDQEKLFLPFIFHNYYFGSTNKINIFIFRNKKMRKMEFSQKELNNCLHVATSAALQAGQVIRKYYGSKNLEIGDKGYGYEKSALVTIADKRAQKIIEKMLIGYDERIGFLGEEDGYDKNPERFTKDFHWSVDPLDGTKAFVVRNNGFAVSIALVKKNGEPLIGVTYFPALDDLYTAIKGNGAFKNNSKIFVPKLDGKVKFLLSEAETLAPEKNQFYNALKESVEDIKQVKSVKPEAHVAPVYKGCLVADSDEPVIYYGIPRKKLGVSVWDFAAIAIIVKESGGYVSDIYGNPLELNRKDSTLMHHKGFLLTTSKELHELTLETFKKMKNLFE